MTVASISKRDEELHLETHDRPIRAPRNSPALQLVQAIRDEAHRFAVTRHRRRRKKRTLRTELTEIRGIGPVTAARLLREFGSVTGVREAPTSELVRVAGQRAATAIGKHYRART